MATRAQARGYAFTFELTGIQEIQRALDQLPRSVTKTVLKNGIKEGLKDAKKTAQATAPKGATGNLARSIHVGEKLKKRKFKHRDRVTVYMGSTAPHAHLVEFGTASRSREGASVYQSDGQWYRPSAGASTGVMPQNAFLTRAWDLSKRQVLITFRQSMWKHLSKAAERLRGKAERGTLGKGAVKELMR